MKTMTCNQLGGACNQTFTAETFEEIAALSKKHGIEMFQKKDMAHLEAMKRMKTLMDKPNAMENWYAEKKQLFNTLPLDNK